MVIALSDAGTTLPLRAVAIPSGLTPLDANASASVDLSVSSIGLLLIDTFILIEIVGYFHHVWLCSGLPARDRVQF